MTRKARRLIVLFYRLSCVRGHVLSRMKTQKAIVVGAGINGVVAAIELRKRGREVVLVDPGPLPHALAASTDISKAVRAAYGADEDYTALAEQSREIWRQWNVQFGVDSYHGSGFLCLRPRSVQPAHFES